MDLAVCWSVFVQRQMCSRIIEMPFANNNGVIHRDLHLTKRGALRRREDRCGVGQEMCFLLARRHLHARNSSILSSLNQPINWTKRGIPLNLIGAQKRT